jgi:anti-sigma28 factor (negative regulator of flagellin synthesis)
MLDINPSKVEYLVKAYSGGTGAFVNDLINTLMNASNGVFDTDKIPYINSFIRKYPEKKWTVIGEYYKMKENDDKWQKSSKEYKKQGDTEIFYDMSHNTEKNNRHSDIKAADKKIDNLKEKFDNGEIDLDEYLEMKANIAEQIINKYQ